MQTPGPLHSVEMPVLVIDADSSPHDCFTLSPFNNPEGKPRTLEAWLSGHIQRAKEQSQTVYLVPLESRFLQRRSPWQVWGWAALYFFNTHTHTHMRNGSAELWLVLEETLTHPGESHNVQLPVLETTIFSFLTHLPLTLYAWLWKSHGLASMGTPHCGAIQTLSQSHK